MREIENLAVSQITVEIRDFQPCILTEDAELLYFGPCLQYMSGMLDMMTRYILEHRGERVRDGDMWLCNDPIIGTAHQPDVGLMCPVFVDGEVFCWVANISHQNDIGGTVPGSFCPNAEGRLLGPALASRRSRSSRTTRSSPTWRRSTGAARARRRTSALDLRATIAGNHAARARILGLVEQVRQGGGQGRDAARRSTPASAPSSRRSTRSPTAPTRERLIQEVSMTGDRGTYPVQTTRAASRAAS